MAQLGDLDRAKALLRSAARAFGPKEAVACARCVVAEAEIALEHYAMLQRNLLYTGVIGLLRSAESDTIQ